MPDKSQRELRELLRYRRSLIQERARGVNRIRKVLEGANIKLGSVASNVLGASGRALPLAITEGTEDPQALASLAKGRLRDKLGELEKALKGVVGPHQRTIIACQLRHLDFLEQEIANLDQEVASRMGPFDAQIQLGTFLPGGERSEQPPPGPLATTYPCGGCVRSCVCQRSCCCRGLPQPKRPDGQRWESG